VRKTFFPCILALAALSAVSCVTEQAPYIKAGADIDALLAEGGKITVDIECNREKWSAVVEDSKWARIQAINRNGNGTGSVVVVCGANDTESERSNAVVISVEGVSERVAFTQAQKDVVKIDRERFEFDHDGGEFSIETRSNIDYAVAVTGDWVRRVSTKATVSRTESFIVDPFESAGLTREADVVFSSSSGTEMSRFKVFQEGPDAITAVSVPGVYGIGGTDYFPSFEDCSQMSLTQLPNGSYTARILYPLSVSVAEISGIPQSIAKGDNPNLNVKIVRNSAVLYNEGRQFKVVKVNDGTAWFKDSSDPNVYIVAVMEEEKL